MKRKILIAFLGLILVASICLSAACDEATDPVEQFQYMSDKIVSASKVVTYETSNMLTSSSKINVKAEGNPLFVYDVRVNHARTFTYVASKDFAQVVIFDFEGTVRIEVEVNDASSVKDVVVRPLEYAIDTTVSSNKISFELQYPANYTLEYNTNSTTAAYKNAVHIFANSIQDDSQKVNPDDLDENTIYIGAGVYKADSIPVNSDNTTVYLDSGAVVYGQIRAEGLNNLTIAGRGVFVGDLYERSSANQYTLPIELQHCTNVTIKDISIFDPAGWAVTLYFCENVTMDNVKIITARANGDGISAQSCKNVTVTGGFVRTWDDSLVVKNTDSGTTDNIVFDNVVVWTDLAQSMEVGYETHGATMNNITFQNITVLHNFHKAAISIHNCDDAAITNVAYKNITIEDAQMLGDNQTDGDNDFLIDFTVAFNSEWTSSGAVRGSISGVTISNIKILNIADTIVSRVVGESASSSITNVAISNVSIKGTMIENLQQLKLVPGAFASNVTYQKTAVATGATIYLAYKNEVADSTAEVSNLEGAEQTGLEIPSFAVIDAAPSYMGTKYDNSKISVSATNGSEDKANSPHDIEPNNTQAGFALDNLLDADKDTLWKNGQWHGLVEEFVAISFVFDEATRLGTIRIFGDFTSSNSNYYKISVFAQRDNSGKWTRQLFSVEYSISAQNSNYTDIKMKSDIDYDAVQLRIFNLTGLTYPTTIALSEVEFYLPSISTGKTVTASEQEDIYNPDYIVDGNDSTYFEGKRGVFPSDITVDFASAYSIKYVNICLPPVLLWPPRDQEIEILGSLDGTNYFTIVAKTAYTFDPVAGNRVLIVLDAPVSTRYFKMVFTSNSSSYGCQISELYVFEG